MDTLIFNLTINTLIGFELWRFKCFLTPQVKNYGDEIVSSQSQFRRSTNSTQAVNDPAPQCDL